MYIHIITYIQLTYTSARPTSQETKTAILIVCLYIQTWIGTYTCNVCISVIAIKGKIHGTYTCNVCISAIAIKGKIHQCDWYLRRKQWQFSLYVIYMYMYELTHTHVMYTAPETSWWWDFLPKNTHLVDLYHQLRTKCHFGFVPQWVSWGRYPLVSSGPVRHLLDSKTLFVWCQPDRHHGKKVKFLSVYYTEIIKKNKSENSHEMSYMYIRQLKCNVYISVTAITEKKVAILIRALNCNPSSEQLLVAYLETIEDQVEPDKLQHLWEAGNSCDVAYECVMSHMNESCHIWMSHVTYEWVMSHMNESCHIWMIHVTYEWVMSHMTEWCHIWMSHVTYAWVMSRMNEWCHV